VTTQSEIEPTASADVFKIPKRWDERLAGWISNVLSPPVVAVGSLALIVQRMETASHWWWAVYFMILTVLIPVGYIVWKVRRGEITDFHVRLREQRIRPLTLTLAGGLASLGSLWIGNAPRLLLFLAGMGVAQVAFILLVTTQWKISGHGAAVSSLAVFLCGLYGLAATPTLLAIPLVAWARVRLNRHTLSQTVLGSLAGTCFTLAVLALLYGKL
jgi:membrane-associated phospholipid phosphatase